MALDDDDVRAGGVDERVQVGVQVQIPFAARALGLEQDTVQHLSLVVGSHDGHVGDAGVDADVAAAQRMFLSVAYVGGGGMARAMVTSINLSTRSCSLR